MQTPEQQFSIMVKHLHQMESDPELIDNAHAVLIEDKNEPIIVQRIRAKASKLLLSDGMPNQARIDQLVSEGFRVCSEKEDLFGWETGALFTRKGRIIF